MDKNLKDINMEAKRTEKLASALYLLTSFFDDKEPMKWRLRELGSKLIAMRDNRNIVLEVVSLLTVAKNAGLISDTNYEIIYREFAKLAPENLTIGDIFRKVDEGETYKAIPEARGTQKTVEKTEYNTEKPSLYVSSSVAKSESIKDKTPKDGVVAAKKNSRQNTILSLLKKKKEIQVADVTPFIEGVSEKTIQRELLTMVSSGILRKEGEKRWSRYSLAEE